MSTLQCIGILGHPKRPQTDPVTDRIASSLRERGITTWQYHVWDVDDVRESVSKSDIVVAIGGDGAMLKAARVCAPYAVPVLGVNMGRLGFLTEIANPDDWEVGLDALLRGDYWIEQRMMVSAVILRGEERIAEGIALNDVVVSGSSAGSMIQLDSYIDRHWATTYNCDALIVATPTGSTAYALAAGGPILPPDLNNILILPTAAHLSMDRPIVLSQGARVALRLGADNRGQAVVSVDGSRVAELETGDTVHISASDYTSRFVRMRERNYFYRSLLDRLEPRINRSAPEHTLILDDFED